MRVMYKLFESSWRDDAVVRDATKGIFSSPDRIREINHVGKYYNVSQSIGQDTAPKTLCCFSA